MKAQEFLTKAGDHMQDRASTYDKPQGERSMAATVGAFNAINGTALTEEQGWMFMELLKIVRSIQGEYKADNYEDAVAYAALRGECASNTRGEEPDDVLSLGLKHKTAIGTVGEWMRGGIARGTCRFCNHAFDFPREIRMFEHLCPVTNTIVEVTPNA